MRTKNGDLELNLEVQPGASRSSFPAGFNAWRRCLRAQVRAQAYEGAANAELVAIVADFFHVPARDVAVVSGVTQRQKRIRVAGIAPQAAMRRLQEALDER